MRASLILSTGIILSLFLFWACGDEFYPPLVSDNASVGEFSLEGVEGLIDETQKPCRIDIVFPSERSLEALRANFVLPEGARAFVNTVEQRSGQSVLCYSAGYVRWVIQAADQTLKEYRVYAWIGEIGASTGSLASLPGSSGGAVSSGGAQSVGVIDTFPFKTTKYEDFGPNGWDLSGMDAPEPYYTTYLKFNWDGDTALTPEMVPGVKAVRFRARRGSASANSYFKVQGTVDDSTWVDLLQTVLDSQGGTPFEVKVADHPDLVQYKRFRWVFVLAGGALGLDQIEFNKTN